MIDLKNGYNIELPDDEVKLLDGLPEERIVCCAYCLSRLRRMCDTAGVQYLCTEVRATRGGCVVLVLPGQLCSIPAFVVALEHATEGRDGPTIWSHMPGRPEVAVEFKDKSDRVENWEDFQCRDTWRKCASDANALPIALGVGLLDEDVVLDLAKMSGLAVWGGDTLAQELVLGNIFKTLFSVRGPEVLTTYYLACNYVSMSKEVGLVNAAGYVPEGDADKMVDGTCKWMQKVVDVCDTIKTEIKVRERVFEALGCYTLEEYSSSGRGSLPRIVLFIVDPPSCRPEKGGIRDLYDKMEDAVSEVLDKCGPRFGVHLVLVDFMPYEKTMMYSIVQFNMAGRCSKTRLGCLVHGSSNCCVDDSYAIFGGPEAAQLSRKTMMYRSPENEVFKIHKLGEDVD